MNTNAIAKNYDALSAEERFQLILNAGARGDEAEQDRLVRAGGSITLSWQDHAPYGHAFDEVALQVYVDLLELAAAYTDAFRLSHAASPLPRTWMILEPKTGARAPRRAKARPDRLGKGSSTWRSRGATCSRPRATAGRSSASG
jgi:hypothetical protein